MESDLARAIRTAVDTDGPVWFPALGRRLATYGWRELLGRCGLSPSAYGLDRVRQLAPNAPRHVFAHLALSEIGNSDIRDEILIEHPFAAERHYAKLGLEFYGPDEVDRGEVIQKLSDAFGTLALIPDLFATVGALVRTIHLLRPPGPDYDVSHSDPSVPFSIFVSLPLAAARHGALRLAEAVLHEAMHLQLSLIERVAPALRRNDAQYYSPWRQTMRPVQGILHGLYVFAVIDAALGELASRHSLTHEEVLYFVGRRKEINEAILQVSAVQQSNELTPFGEALVTRLLRSYA